MNNFKLPLRGTFVDLAAAIGAGCLPGTPPVHSSKAAPLLPSWLALNAYVTSAWSSTLPLYIDRQQISQSNF
jgi:hypothetical protein